MRNRMKLTSWRRPFGRGLGFALLLGLLLTLTIMSTAAQDLEDGPVPEAPEDLEQYILRWELSPTTSTVDLLPNQDAYTTSGMPDRNWGSDPNLRVGYNVTNGRGAQRTYFQFPIEVAPQQVIIDNAELHFYRNSFSPAGDQPMGAEVRHLNSQWNANTITWNSNVPAWGSVALTGEIPASVGWGTVNVTQIVQQWVSGERANNGMIVIGNETPVQRERTWYSRNTVNTGLRPFLRVTYTTCTDSTPPSAWVEAFPSNWTTSQTFTVKWNGSDAGGSGIKHFNVQFSTNNSNWQDWKVGTTSTQADFTGDDGSYYFRVQATDNCSNTSSWSGSQNINVDSTPPISTILPFPQAITNTPTWGVFWAGSDGNGIGIDRYDIYWKYGNNPWSIWLSVPPSTTSTTFNAINGDGPYYFRAQAVDKLGNAEPMSDLPEASIMLDVNGDVLPLYWMPIVAQAVYD